MENCGLGYFYSERRLNSHLAILCRKSAKKSVSFLGKQCVAQITWDQITCLTQREWQGFSWWGVLDPNGVAGGLVRTLCWHLFLCQLSKPPFPHR